MTRPQFPKRTSRPREHLAAAGVMYPDAWSQADAFRAQRGRDGLPDWPDWCYLPLAAWFPPIPVNVTDVGELPAVVRRVDE